MNTIPNAIARSAKHDEIVYVNLSDCLVGDTADEINNAANEFDQQAYRDLVRSTIQDVVTSAQMAHDDTDDVENDNIWELWGTTVDGDDYRVHIRLSR